MTEIDAARIVTGEVGLSFAGDDAFVIQSVDQIAQEAAKARARGEWGTDCGWRSDPWRASYRITEYLDSFLDD